MNTTIQIILIILIIIFIYNFLNEKDKFQSTSKKHEIEKTNEDKKYRLNNPRLDSIKRYIDDKQQLLEDVKNYNCKLSDDAVNILNQIKILKDSKHKKENIIKENEKELKNIDNKSESIFNNERQINAYLDNLKTIKEQIKILEENKKNIEANAQQNVQQNQITLINEMLSNFKNTLGNLKGTMDKENLNGMNESIKEFKIQFSKREYYITESIKLKEEIKAIDSEIQILKEKLNNKYCPQLLKDISTNNFKTSSFLEDINDYHLSKIANLNKNMKQYKTFSDNYSVKNESVIADSLDYLNSHLQMKSFNDNVPALEMMKNTLEFSNEVPPIVSEEEMVRLYPYNFTDFNGNYSINLGHFNYRLIDNRHIIKVEIATNEEVPISQNNTLNSISSNNIGNDLDKRSFGSIKVYDTAGDTILSFKIINVARSELPEFPTTTIFMNIQSQNIYNDPNKTLTEKEQILKHKKIKILKHLGLKDGGIYLHGNDGQFNLYSFNKLLILNMSPI
jgi:hypothetical protein